MVREYMDSRGIREDDVASRTGYYHILNELADSLTGLTRTLTHKVMMTVILKCSSLDHRL